jgi:hypothetical protein
VGASKCLADFHEVLLNLIFALASDLGLLFGSRLFSAMIHFYRKGPQLAFRSRGSGARSAFSIPKRRPPIPPTLANAADGGACSRRGLWEA